MAKKPFPSLYTYHRMLWEASDQIRKLNGNPSQTAAEILLRLSVLAEKNSPVVMEIEYEIRQRMCSKGILGSVSLSNQAKNWLVCRIIDNFIDLSAMHGFLVEIKAVRRILSRLSLALVLDGPLLFWIEDMTDPERVPDLQRGFEARMTKEKFDRPPGAVRILKGWTTRLHRFEDEADAPDEEQSAVW